MEEAGEEEKVSRRRAENSDNRCENEGERRNRKECKR